MPSGQGAGTNPIHNKKPKKKPAGDEDEEDKAFKAKQMKEKKEREEMAKRKLGSGLQKSTKKK